MSQISMSGVTAVIRALLAGCSRSSPRTDPSPGALKSVHEAVPDVEFLLDSPPLDPVGGTENLPDVDSSVIPLSIGGNPIRSLHPLGRIAADPREP